jgi:hypothetical protein
VDHAKGRRRSGDRDVFERSRLSGLMKLRFM